MRGNSVRVRVDEGNVSHHVAYVQSLAASNKVRFHLPDGPEQIARDNKMAAGGTDWSFKAIEWIYGHDPVAAVETGNLGFPRPA